MEKENISFIVVSGSRKIRTFTVRVRALRKILLSSSVILVVLIGGTMYSVRQNIRTYGRLKELEDSSRQAEAEIALLRDVKERLGAGNYVLKEKSEFFPHIVASRVYADDQMEVYSAYDMFDPYPDTKEIRIDETGFSYDQQQQFVFSFKMHNAKEGDRIAGYNFVIGELARGDSTDYRSFPNDVTLDKGEIVDYRQGNSFSILRFKEIAVTWDLSSGRLRFLSIYVFSKEGTLLLYAPFYINIKT